jgi:hypothetical protein
MAPRIEQTSPGQFIFEYEEAYPQEQPRLIKGQTFIHDGKTYRIVHYHQVFGEQSYCSFLVTAKAVSA